MKKFRLIFILSFLFALAYGCAPLWVFAADNVTEFNSALLKTKIKKIVLPNNLTFLICPKENSSAASFCGIIKAGSIYDPEGKSGLSNLTANIFSSYLQEKFKEKEETQIKFTLSDANYYTENIRFEIKTTSALLPRAINILSDAFVNFDPAKELFQNAKDKIKNELSKKLSSYEVIKQTFLYNQNYSKNHPYNHYFAGDAASLDNLSFEDVSSFYKNHYAPKGAIIAVAGNINPDEAIKIFEESFSKWENNAANPAVIFPQDVIERKINIQAGNMSSGTYAIIFSARCVSRTSPDYYAVNALNHILGGYPYKNRLMDALRKNRANFAYSIFSPALDPFCWQIRVNFSNPDNLESVIKAARECLKKIAKEGVSKEELSRAQKYFTQRFPELLNDPKNLAQMLALTEYYNLGLDYFDKYDSCYNGLTPAKINQIAQKYLKPDNMNVLVIKK